MAQFKSKNIDKFLKWWNLVVKISPSGIPYVPDLKKGLSKGAPFKMKGNFLIGTFDQLDENWLSANFYYWHGGGKVKHQCRNEKSGCKLCKDGLLDVYWQDLEACQAAKDLEKAAAEDKEKEYILFESK